MAQDRKYFMHPGIDPGLTADSIYDSVRIFFTYFYTYLIYLQFNDAIGRTRDNGT